MGGKKLRKAVIALPRKETYLTVAKVCNLILLFWTYLDSLPRKTQSTEGVKCLDLIKTRGLRTNVSQRDFNANDRLVANQKIFCGFRKSGRLAKRRRFSSEYYWFVSLLRDQGPLLGSTVGRLYGIEFFKNCITRFYDEYGFENESLILFVK